MQGTSGRLQLAKWKEAELFAEDLRSNPTTSLRLNAAHSLGRVARPGGCFVRLRTGSLHCGVYGSDAYAYGVATSALCEALLTDSSAAVHDAVIDALRRLDPVGDEAVKHALLSALSLTSGAESRQLQAAVADALAHLFSHHDLELVARLSLMLEAGAWDQSAWIDAKYQELCAMLPCRGRAALPRRLCRLMAQYGDTLYTGRTLLLVLPRSAGGNSSQRSRLTSIAVPSLPEARAGSLVGYELLLSTHTHTSRGHEAARVYLGPHEPALHLQTQARHVEHDTSVSFLTLSFSCLGRGAAMRLNPLLGARTYKLVIESEKVEGALVSEVARGVLSPVFRYSV